MTTTSKEPARRPQEPILEKEPRACSQKDLEGFEQTLTDLWGFAPRSYQMQAICAQLKREDVLVHAGTGLGKTAIAAGPHAHPSAIGKVTLMVSPLLALHDEMVRMLYCRRCIKLTIVYR